MFQQICRSPHGGGWGGWVWVGETVSTNLKSELLYLDSLNFYWSLTDFRGPPLWGGGVGGWGGTLSGCLAHAHEQWCHIGIPQDFPMGAAICMKLSSLYMYARVCMCMYMCTCVHVWGTPQTPWQSPTHIHPPPPPNGGDSWNQSKVNKNWTNQDIWILFEDFGSLNICALI